MGAYRTPHVDMGRYRRVGVGVALRVDMTPPQRTCLLGPDAYQETQHNVGVQAVRPCRTDHNGLPECERLDGRPSWPAGASTSMATLRRTLSLASACLMARVSPACVMPTVRVARAAARPFRAARTVGAESSRSGSAPMMSMIGSRTSRWVLTVFGARPASPSASR